MMTPARPQAARLGVDHLMSLMSPVPLPRTPPRPPPPAASSQYWLALARTHLILPRRSAAETRSPRIPVRHLSPGLTTISTAMLHYRCRRRSKLPKSTSVTSAFMLTAQSANVHRTGALFPAPCRGRVLRSLPGQHGTL
jgi:hypothetical protein